MAPADALLGTAAAGGIVALGLFAPLYSTPFLALLEIQSISDGMPARFGRLSDSALVCRGGLCTADRFAKGSGVTVDASGNLQNVSVQSAAGKTVEQLTIGVKNPKVGVTTVGDVRRAGGDVVPSPNPGNPYHCTLCGIAPQKAEELFTPVIPNPNR
ncbi:MAG: hypothetical protein ACREXP_01160 [Steroidobacteraceae bacterium]